MQEVNKEIGINHTEIPCFYDDRDKGWGRKRQIIVLLKEQIGVGLK